MPSWSKFYLKNVNNYPKTKKKLIVHENSTALAAVTTYDPETEQTTQTLN